MMEMRLPLGRDLFRRGLKFNTQKENPNLEYVIPEEGSNIWINSRLIPKNAENKGKW